MTYYEMSAGFEGDLSADGNKEVLLKMLKEIREDVKKNGKKSNFISFLGKETEEHEFPQIKKIKGTRNF